MKLKNFIVLTFLLMLLFLSIGVATANENATLESVEFNADDNLTDYNGYYSDDEKYNAKIIAEDITREYDVDCEVPVYIVDNNNNPISGAEPYFDGYLNSWYDSDGYYYFYPMYLDAGTHNIEISLDDGIYRAEPAIVNIKIVKSVFYGDIKCKTYYGTDKTTLTMKATVYNPDEDCYEDGYVTFKVNGKSYKVKTKNGVATKTIKIKKAGTYTYTAKFTNKNYKSSVTGKAKLYVYKTSKSARTFKIKSYKIVVPLNKYKQFVNAKNTNKLIYLTLKTNKYVKQKVYFYNKGFKAVKARVSILFTYGGKNGGQYGAPNKYYMTLMTPYQNPGYDYCTPWLYGAKKSTTINKLNSAKTTKW